jgi:thioredoxin 1
MNVSEGLERSQFHIPHSAFRRVPCSTRCASYSAVRRRRRQLLRRPTVSPVIDVTDADFAAVVGASALPAIVDCWAEWCEPCKVMSAYVEFLATDFAGQALVAALDVDENPATSERFGVMGLPTLLVLQQGRRSTASSASRRMRRSRNVSRACSSRMYKKAGHRGHGGGTESTERKQRFKLSVISV